jgi:hypothetical protein
MTNADYGTCDNCGAQGARLHEWTATRPDNWPTASAFMLCRRCVTSTTRNLVGRRLPLPPTDSTEA